MLNARITFSNLCGCDEPLSSVWVPAPGSVGEASGTTVGSRGLHSFLVSESWGLSLACLPPQGVLSHVRWTLLCSRCPRGTAC